MSRILKSPLVTAQELSQAKDAGDLVIVDCRFSLADPAEGRRRYEQSHVPGARYAHLDEHLSSPPSSAQGRHPLPTPKQLSERLGRWGILPTTSVVSYDDSGGAFAARLWWMLRSLGHEDAAVLDGGYAAWLAAGLPTESALPVVAANEYTPISTSDATLVTTDELEERVARGALLLDARAPERFSGAVEPIDPVAGHIPGAVNLPFQALLSNGHFKPRDLLRAAFNEAAGGELPQDVVAMCGSGVTACHLLLAMEVAELGTGNLYAGSWSEWIRDPSRRVAVGN